MGTRWDTVVIGGGQAGLAMGWHLARQGRDFLILDAAPSVGAVWRSRWDSLRLFTPARYDALPGMPFPAEPDHLPGKDEVASYLERYAYVFGLPVRSGEPALAVRPVDGGRGFEVVTPRRTYHADQVVIATGPLQTPIVPGVARGLGPDVAQVHSGAYRAPDQLPDGPVVVVGAGNSGVQIAAELAATRRPTWLAVGEALPALPLRLLGRSIFSWLERSGALRVPVTSRLGRRASARDWLIGQTPRQVARESGVRLAGRITAADGAWLTDARGARIEAAAVVWATGFRPEHRFVGAPVFDEHGRPEHVRGVTRVPGLYFLGLPWLHTRGSALLGWVGNDAAYLAERIRERAAALGAGSPPPMAPARPSGELPSCLPPPPCRFASAASSSSRHPTRPRSSSRCSPGSTTPTG